jgi:hypothetical protein
MNASTSPSAQLSQCARRLEALVRRTSTFVAQQLGQLDDIGLQLAADVREFGDVSGEQDQDAEWLQQKADDERRIDEQLEHLARAWKELESEQRRLLMLQRSAPGETLESPAAGFDSPSATGVFESPLPVPETRVPQRSRDLIDETAPQDAAAAALQFQKLKREIRQQARRQR